jgi:beta-RFAP synthase
MTVRVVAPCRLHFGLLHVPVPGLTHWPDGTPVRRFGGVGLMIEPPAVTVSLAVGEPFSAEGSLSDRARAGLVLLHQKLGNRRMVCGRHVADGPPEHVGLGVGTALSLAVARAAAGPLPVAELARLARRGRRSGIGVHGFDRGGILFDGGKGVDDFLPTLYRRLPFPGDWRVVLLRPKVGDGWHGDREQAAFDRPRDPARARATTDRLIAIAFDELAPAVADNDFPTFADAAHRYNRLAGEPFAADQGGPFAGPEITGLIETLRSWGVAGVGQSSWGPTVFAFAEDEGDAHRLADRARRHFPNLSDLTVTRANNRGAMISSD